MDSSPVLRVASDGICTITVNRPDKLNALDRATLEGLDAAFAAAAADDTVRVVVLTGAGPRPLLPAPTSRR